MNNSHSTLQIYLHVRVMVGIIVGLIVARLLTGMARFIQHPKLYRIYFVHLGWAFTILLSVIHFWWWEFRLEEVRIGILGSMPACFFTSSSSFYYRRCSFLTNLMNTRGSKTTSSQEKDGFSEYWH